MWGADEFARAPMADVSDLDAAAILLGQAGVPGAALKAAEVPAAEPAPTGGGADGLWEGGVLA